MVSRTALIWGGLLLAGFVTAIAAPNLIARWQARPAALGEGARGTVAAFPAPQETEFILLIGRREERMALDDPTPHRNSRIALYRRVANSKDTAPVWQRVTDALPVRSHTTALDPPVAGESYQADRTYGYASVPLGIFTLEEGPWRDGVTPAFRLSDWGRFNGILGLRETQVLQRITRTEPGSDEFETEIVRTALSKSGSWLHPTHTERWSHGDSHGCINLFQPSEPDGQVHDYDVLLSWFEQYGLEPGPGGDLVALVLVPFEWVGEGQDGLRAMIDGTLIDRAQTVQGYQIEEMP